jgi:hypothetical protein
MSIVENLRALNSKERFYLFTEAVGSDGLKISKRYLERIEKVFGIKITENYFAGIDFHLDWIYAALNVIDIKDYKMEYQNTDGCIVGNQEDIDLIIAYEDKGITHIIMVEAKCAGSWNNSQLESKSNRFKSIFNSIDADKIKIHFLLTSPKMPIKIDKDILSEYMKTNGIIEWIPLTNVPKLIRVTRIDKNTKNQYLKWMIKPRS